MFPRPGGSAICRGCAPDLARVGAPARPLSQSYGTEAGAGISDREKTVHLVDVFYSLVTDIYGELPPRGSPPAPIADTVHRVQAQLASKPLCVGGQDVIRHDDTCTKSLTWFP